MEKKLLFFVLLFNIINFSMAQGGHGHTTSGSATQESGSVTPSTSSVGMSSGNTPTKALSGYVYRLPRYYHIKYKSGNDNTSRYWDSKSGGYIKHFFQHPFNTPLFFSHRLLVAIKQDTGGILHISIYGREFGNEALLNTAKITDYGGMRFDVARPLNDNDNADSFYLQVLKKRVLGDYISYLSIPYSTRDFGTLTIPFKYRPAPKNVRVYTSSGSQVQGAQSESDPQINIGMYLGRRWGRTKYYYDQSRTTNTLFTEIIGFAGPSIVPLNLSNVDSAKGRSGGFISTSSTNYSYNGPSNLIAASVGGGFLLGYEQFSFGLFLGADFPITPNYGWVYRNKPWIGFGIGINLNVLSSGNPAFQSNN